MSESPIFVLSAAPRQAASFQDLFGNTGPRELLERPRELRRAGWDLRTGDQARIARGEFLELGRPDGKLVQLYEDGTLIARVPGDESFLAWASTGHGSFWQHPRLNPLALIEFVYNFTAFYARVLAFLNPLPLEVRCRAEFRPLINGDAHVYLLPGGLETHMWISETRRYPAPASTMERQHDAYASDLRSQPERVAYAMVERIYTWFGVPPDDIPYVAETGDARAVDVQLLTAGGKRKL